MEKRQVICILVIILIVIYLIKIIKPFGKVKHNVKEDLKISNGRVSRQNSCKNENKNELIEGNKNINEIKKTNIANKSCETDKISELIMDKKLKDEDDKLHFNEPPLPKIPSESIHLKPPLLSVKPLIPFKTPHLKLNKLNLKCNQEIINSPYDLLKFEIKKFINIFRKGKHNIEMNNILELNTKRFYRMGTSLGDVLYFFMLVSQTDENSCERNVHKQNIYKMFIMLYTNKLLQTSAINEIMKKGDDSDDEDSSFDSDSTFDEDEKNHVHGFYLPFPKNTFIENQTLSFFFSNLISEFSSILDQMPLKMVNNVNLKILDLLQNLINVMNCFYVRLQPQLNENELKDLVEIYKEMLMHLKKAIKIVDYVKRVL